MKFSKIFITGLLISSSSVFAAPVTPPNGGAGISNCPTCTSTINVPVVFDGSASSAFSINSLTKGSRPYPLKDTSERNAIPSPEQGLIDYTTTTNTLDYFTGSEWQNILTAQNVNGTGTVTVTNNGDGTVTINGSGGSVPDAAYSSFSTQNNSSATTFALTNTFYPVYLGSSFSVDQSSDFTNQFLTISGMSAPVMTYTGAVTQFFNVTLGDSMRGAVPSSATYTYCIYIRQANGTIVPTQYCQLATADNLIDFKGVAPLSGNIQLAQGDSVFEEVKNITNTNAIYVAYSNFSATSVAGSSSPTLQNVFDNSATYPESNIDLPASGSVTVMNGSETAFGVDDSGIASTIGLGIHPPTGEDIEFVQVGDAGALIQVTSTLHGVKIHPDMTTSERNLIVGQKPVGMGIYNIGQNTLQFWTTNSDWTELLNSTSDQTVGGVKTFSSSIVGNLTGNADTVTNGVYTTGSYADPAWITSLAGSKLTAASVDLTTKVTGNLPFTNGGFGFNTATMGDLFYASATNTPNKLSDVATGQVLTSGGVGAAPVYSASPSLSSLTLTTAAADALLFSGTAISGTNSVLRFANTLGDGRYIDFGLSGRSLAVLSNGALAMTYGLTYSASANGYIYAFTGVPGVAIELSNTNGFLKYVGAGTINNTATLSTALSWDTTTGDIAIPAKLGIGASQTQIITNAISIRGANSSSASAVNWFTAADQYPIFQLMPYAHNNTSYSMDAYYDGSAWKSSYANSSYQIAKFQDNLDFNYGIAAVGATLSWGTAFRVNSAGNMSFPIAGKTLTYKTGTNACVGSGAVMVAGVVTVSTTCALTGDIITLMKTATGGTPTAGLPVISIINATSFTLTGTSLDTSTWSWKIDHTN